MNPHMIVCDLETTDRVISNAQILSACFIILDENLKELDRHVFNIRPRYWDKYAEEAVAIHGITRERAMGFNCRTVVSRRMLDFIPSGPLYFVCHANRKAGTFGCFDRQVLNTFFLDGFLNKEDVTHFAFDQKCPTNKVISTHTLAKKLLSLDKYNLKSVADHFGIPLNHHDAESDAQVCAEILRRLNTIGDIYAISEEEYDGSGVRKEEKARVRTKPGKTRDLSWYQ